MSSVNSIIVQKKNYVVVKKKPRGRPPNNVVSQKNTLMVADKNPTRRPQFKSETNIPKQKRNAVVPSRVIINYEKIISSLSKLSREVSDIKKAINHIMQTFDMVSNESKFV